MSTKTELRKFTDFDRLLLPKNFIITLLGSIGAFACSYYDQTIIDISNFSTPFFLSFTIAIIIFVSLYTRNIASAGIVSLVGALGIVSPFSGSVEWFLGYIVILFILAMILGRLADRLRLVLYWVKFHMVFALGIAAIFMGLSASSNWKKSTYTDRGYKIGVGGDLGTGNHLPLMEISVFVVLMLLVLLMLFLTRGQIILTQGGSKKYSIFGWIFFLLGQGLVAVTLYLYTKTITETDILQITKVDKQLNTIGELITHQASGNYYAVMVQPFNINIVIAVSTVLTAIGLGLMYIGRNSGNVEGMRGGYDIAFLAAPLGVLLFQLLGSYTVQNYIQPGGFYISVELMSVFSTMLFAMFFFSQWIARISLFVVNKILPN